MATTPEWIQALTGIAALLLAMVSGPVGWYLRGRVERAKALPLVQWDGKRLLVQNRLDNPIVVTRVQARGKIALSLKPAKAQQIYSRVADPKWTIGPGEQSKFPLSADRSINEIIVTISSSCSTFRDKRMTVHIWSAV